MLLSRHYEREHYLTVFNPETGFFARIQEAGSPEPFWSHHGPELLDISITSWCDKQCATCYRSANRHGTHMALRDYAMIIRQAARMDVYQVALGGGNPNQHPDFIELLRITRQEFGIVPNYTTNGRGLTDDVLEATAKFCGAVAVSAYEPYEDVVAAVRRLRSFGIRTNIHFVLDAESVITATKWLINPPVELSGANAIIFLNYKPVGRGGARTRCLNQNPKHIDFFRLALSDRPRLRIGFDSCMVSGLAQSCKVDPISYDACEAARFSMYVSETLTAYPCSFMESTHQGLPLSKDNMIHVWQDSDLFQEIRNQLKESSCGNCPRLSLCRGGCPVFPEIDLCSMRSQPPRMAQV